MVSPERLPMGRKASPQNREYQKKSRRGQLEPLVISEGIDHDRNVKQKCEVGKNQRYGKEESRQQVSHATRE